MICPDLLEHLNYHVPVNADIPKVNVRFVNKKDPYTNPMGSKGLGEIALVGVAPAIANAVFNATGKRIRSLRITLAKLIEAYARKLILVNYSTLKF